MGVALLGLALLLALRMARFRSQQVAALPAAALQVDAARVAETLAAALRLPTVSDAASFDGAQFLSLHRHLETSFPRVHARLEREVVSQYSLLYRWPGSDAALRP